MNKQKVNPLQLLKEQCDYQWNLANETKDLKQAKKLREEALETDRLLNKQRIQQAGFVGIELSFALTAIFGAFYGVFHVLSQTQHVILALVK